MHMVISCQRIRMILIHAADDQPKYTAGDQLWYNDCECICVHGCLKYSINDIDNDHDWHYSGSDEEDRRTER